MITIMMVIIILIITVATIIVILVLVIIYNKKVDIFLGYRKCRNATTTMYLVNVYIE